jgi:arylsulfatase A-like enzyme
MNGAHRQHGVLVLNGPMFRAGEVDAAVWDIAPTLLHALGEAIPGHMEGSVLPVFHTMDAPRRAPDSAVVSTLDPSIRPGDDEAMRRRLAKLGYL